MKNRTFEPWVGNNYAESGLNGHKVLFLGEAHYGKEDDKIPSFTQDIVMDHGLNQGSKKFFTIITKLGLSKYAHDPLTQEDREAFWNSIAFYNYVQDFVSEGARVPPTEKMWLEAQEPFIRTIQELNPDLIVLLSERLKGRLPMLDEEVPICVISHPSSRKFAYETHIPLLSDAINQLNCPA